ncbi:MAG: hypothetical protein ACLRXC_05885 [[Clostridium] leptum]
MTISLIRTLLLYVMIIAAVRIMGKRQISELQTSELVVTLLISDIAAIPMQNTGQPLSSGIIPILVLVSCEIAASFFMVKIPGSVNWLPESLRWLSIMAPWIRHK